MTWIMVDVESDGPCPGIFSMISFGAVIVERDLGRTFYGKCRPISDRWDHEALAISGFSRDECMRFAPPEYTMPKFKEWVKSNCKDSRPRFIADNNGFDWQFINYYFHKYCDTNPFGYSSTNLGSLYKGAVRDMYKSFKGLRKTRHTHNPVDDAMGNAEALLEMLDIFELKLNV